MSGKKKHNPPEGTPTKIPLEELVENTYNPRKRFDDAPMKELTDSIGRVGLIQPLAVRVLNSQYEVIVGIRRLKALQTLHDGNFKVPCNLFNIDEKQAQIMSVTENTARQSMTPIEEARAYAHYFNYKVDELSSSLNFGKPFRMPSIGLKEEQKAYAKQIGQSPNTILHRIRLLFLTEHVQNMLENKKISLTVAESLVNLMAILDPGERAIRMNGLAEKYTVDSENTVAQLDHEINTILENYWKGSKELQQKIEEEEKILKHRESELQAAIDAFKSEIGEDLVAKYYEGVEFSENPRILEETQVLLNLWETERKTLVRATEFKELSQKQHELHDQRDRKLINAQYIDKHPGIDECPFCGAGLNAPNLSKQIDELSAEIKGIEERKEEISVIQTTIDKTAKTLKSKASAFKTQYDACETLKEKLEGGEIESE